MHSSTFRSTAMVLLGACLLWPVVSRAGGSIQITAPNSGGTFVAGQTMNVTWVASGLPVDGHVAVFLRHGLEGPGVSIGLADPPSDPEFRLGDGVASFLVPMWTGDGADVYVEVWVHDSLGSLDRVASDVSDAPISITGSQAVRRFELDDAALGSGLTAGSPYELTWTAENVDGRFVAFPVFDGDTIVWSAGSAGALDGKVRGVVPQNLGNGADYSILAAVLRPGLVRRGAPVLFDESIPFEVTGSDPRPAVTVTSPNGGEMLTGGQSSTMCWSVSDPEGFIQAFVLDDNGGQSALTGYVARSECHSFTPCAHDGGGGFRVGVVQNFPNSLVVKDRSDAAFTITPTAEVPTAEVINPNGGGSFSTGAVVDIDWLTTAPGNANISIELEATGSEGALPVFLGSTFANDAPFEWTVCPSFELDPAYRIQVCASTFSCPDVCDVSDSTFQITLPPGSPTVRLTSPKHDATWTAGSTQTITWDVTNGVGHDVELFFTFVTLSNPSTPIAVVPATDEQYEWTIPKDTRDNRNYSIIARITDGPCVVAFDRADQIAVWAIDCPCGDIDSDGVVGLNDLRLFADCFGFHPNISTECTCSDFDGSQKIDLRDYAVLQNNVPVPSGSPVPSCP